MTALIVIDDSADEHVVTRLMLKRADIEVEYFGFETPDTFFAAYGQSLVADMQLAIVAVDLNLVVADGTDIVRRMNSDSRFKDFVIGVCTGSQDPADKKSAMAAGARFFVTKPFNASALERIVEACPELEMNTTKSGSRRIIRVN